MRIGVIGVGTISTAVVTGWCRTTTDAKPVMIEGIVLSPRNSTKAAALQAKFPELITVASSNQAVVDTSDVVVLALRPQDAAPVIEGLAFMAGQTVLSLMAVVDMEALHAAVHPATKVFRACPLPPAARGEGAVILCAPDRDETMFNLMDMVGTVVEVTTEDQLAALQSVTCLMGPFYQQLKTCQDWLVENGIDALSGSRYCGAMFQAVANDSALKSESIDGFADLIAEQTPQGLNETAIAGLTERGVYTGFKEVLDLTKQRLTGTAKLPGSEGSK